MSDHREILLTNIKSALNNSRIPIEYMSLITDIFIRNLDQYEISPKCTEIACIDTETEQLLKLFAGSKLSEGLSRKTISSYVGFLKKYSIEIGKPVHRATAFDIRAYLLNRQEQVQLVTCETNRACLSSFYSWMFNEDIIQKNPMAKIAPIKHEDKVKQAFTDIEIEALRNACVGKRERAEFELLLSSGARVNELCSMDISDVNFTTLEILIREGKGNKQRKTFMNETCKYYLEDYLQARKDKEVFLFRSREHKRLSTGAVERDLKILGERANVPNVHPHRCRRTFATSLYKRGMDIRAIQLLMGHSDINTTMRYISMEHSTIKAEYMKHAR